MGSPKSAAGVALLILVVSACSGSGSASPGAASPAPASSDATSATAAPTQAPSDAAVASTPPVGGDIDLCSLITAADLKTATGADYGEGKPDDYGQCTWRVGDAAVNNGDGQLIIALQPATLDTIKGAFPGGIDLSVSGHAAYWDPATGLQSIWVDIGGRTLVMTFDPVAPDGQAIAQALAEIAVSKL